MKVPLSYTAKDLPLWYKREIIIETVAIITIMVIIAFKIKMIMNKLKQDYKMLELYSPLEKYEPAKKA
jgi:hypothetical protein